MKDIFCIAVFAGKLLDFLVFVNALRPGSIAAVKLSMAPTDRRMERSRIQGCDFTLGRVRYRCGPAGDRQAHC